MKVNVTIPVFNEVKQLAVNVSTVVACAPKHCKCEYEFVIANNGSTDGTLEVARTLTGRFPGLRVVQLTEKGRGRALRQAWSESHADILSYMDVDLSTDLGAFRPLIEAVTVDGFDLATGSRLLPRSVVQRGWKREFISRCYNRLVKMMFRTRFSDAQCGFKAIRKEAASELLPLTEDTGWFFDTELMVLAEKLGYHICDLPVTWADDTDSRVRILRTVLDDLRGLLRLRRNLRMRKYDETVRESAYSGV